MIESETQPNISEIVSLNQNTGVLDKYISNFSAENVIYVAPEKVKRRVKINLLGLNGLATTIVTPEYADILNIDTLKRIIDYSNAINVDIGLPKTNDLIIRSSTPPFFHPFIRKISEKSEPALLVRNVYGKTSYRYFGNENSTSNSLDDFLENCGKNTFLLIHDDNYDLQTQALHGSVYQKGYNVEFYFRTGSLQAREFGNPEDGYPTFRINTNNLSDIVKLSAGMAIKSAENNSVIESSSLSIRTTSCQPYEAENLTRDIQQNTDIVLYAYEQVKNSFGNGATMEFRIYQSIDGWVGQKLHVLDVDI